MSRGTTARDARSPHAFSPHGSARKNLCGYLSARPTRILGSSHGFLAGFPRTRSVSAGDISIVESSAGPKVQRHEPPQAGNARNSAKGKRPNPGGFGLKRT